MSSVETPYLAFQGLAQGHQGPALYPGKIAKRTTKTQHNIPHEFRYEATEALHGLGDYVPRAADKLAEVFRVHACRESRRAHKVR